MPLPDNHETKSVSAPTGFLVVDKPEGISSMGAVAAVKRRFRWFGRIRAGHGGTLDPLATGVLVIGVGTATRMLERVVSADKEYRTLVDLSAFTTTDDREGERTEVLVPAAPSESIVLEALERFRGEVRQRPPAFSAIKVRGRRAYRLARSGEAPEMPERIVRIDQVDLIAYRWPFVELRIACGKGTYIRSIARDLGTSLGTGGHCASLRRTAVGVFTESIAHPLDDLPETLDASDLLDIDLAGSVR
jgi:tRNA pseudouridine55 synthase